MPHAALVTNYSNDFAAPDKLYHNNRDGTFTDVIDSVVPHMPFSSMGSDLGDVNNDGIVDPFVADMAATTHQVLLGRFKTWSAPAPIPRGHGISPGRRPGSAGVPGRRALI